jgi:hypothetical protein
MSRAGTTSIVAATLALAAVSTLAVEGQAPQGDGPRFTTGTTLQRPADYRAWPFLGSGLGLSYEGGADAPNFTNTFVNPSSYRAFLDTGRWPNGTTFVLEFRRGQAETKLGKGTGRFQAELIGLEAEVKDSRFADGWAYYNFGRAGAFTDTAAPLDQKAAARCVECHTEHTAVERTFVQFYPTLLDVARQKGTVKPGF